MKYCKRHGKELKNYEECKVEECFYCKMELKFSTNIESLGRGIINE